MGGSGWLGDEPHVGVWSRIFCDGDGDDLLLLLLMHSVCVCVDRRNTKTCRDWRVKC